MAQLVERQAAALSSPSTPAIERELDEIEGELRRVVLSAGLPMSPVRQQLVLTESEEHLVEAAETAVQNSTAASATVQNCQLNTGSTNSGERSSSQDNRSDSNSGGSHGDSRSDSSSGG